MTEEVSLAVGDNIAVISLTAPKRMNALTVEMSEELVSAIRTVNVDESIGALVLCAEGSAFCAGAHRSVLADIKANALGYEEQRSLATLYSTFVELGRAQVPTIAAINGAAVGAGLNLALAADLRIVTAAARLSSGFQRIGLHPGGGHFALLNRKGGSEAASAVGLFGEVVSGRQAVEMGLAWAIVDDERDLMTCALGIAERVARDPELSRASVASLRLESGYPPLSWEESVEVERAAQLWSFARGK